MKNSNKSNRFGGLSKKERRLLNKKLAHASSLGEKRGCTSCGVLSLASWPLPYFVGLLKDSYVAVCQECKGALLKGPAYAVQWKTDPVWQVNDQGWFAENLNRHYSIREPLGQEVEALKLRGTANQSVPKEVVIIVWKKDSGVRVRVPVIPPDGPLFSFTDAGIAKWLSFAVKGKIESLIPPQHKTFEAGAEQ